MLCKPSVLKRNMRRDCNVRLTTGVEEIYYLFQLRDLLSYAVDADNNIIITSIVLRDGATLKVYQGFPKGTEPNVGSEDTDYGLKLPQSFKFAIRSNSPETKAEVMALVGANDLVVIYKRAGQGDFEEMGIDNGMRLTSGGLAYAPNDANSGAFVITLTNADAEILPHTIRHKTGATFDTAEYLANLALADD